MRRPISPVIPPVSNLPQKIGSLNTTNTRVDPPINETKYRILLEKMSQPYNNEYSWVLTDQSTKAGSFFCRLVPRQANFSGLGSVGLNTGTRPCGVPTCENEPALLLRVPVCTDRSIKQGRSGVPSGTRSQPYYNEYPDAPRGSYTKKNGSAL